MAFNGIKPASPEAIVEKLLKEATPKGNCLICSKAKDRKGYAKVGCYMIDIERVVLAHRLVYQVKRGPIPKGSFVLHTCDTPSCINPEHLYAGAAWENTRDMLRKRRGANGTHRGYGWIRDPG
jgi:hypothetical protein